MKMKAGKHHSTDAPEVSVLMPCFNVEDTVDAAVESVLAGDFSDFELVAVDDGSTDGTADRLNWWSSQDARVRVLSRPHRGIIDTLNVGLAACRGEFIARMDSDDWSWPERLGKQRDFLREHGDIALVGCQVEGFPRNKVRQGFQAYLDWLNGLVSTEDIHREIFVESPVVHPSVMLRRDWLDRVGHYQEHGWPEDYDLWLRLHVAGARLAKVPQTLLSWREDPDRLTRTDSRYSVKNFLRAKAHYLMRGPLRDREGVIIWGAGQMGRRIAKHLDRAGAPLLAFVDIDPKKIGRTKRGKPIIPTDQVMSWWNRVERPVLLAAVGSRGARQLIREQLEGWGLQEARDWWAVA